MMNMFPIFKLSSKMIFHYPTMFANLFTFNRNSFIFSFRLMKRLKSIMTIFFKMNFGQTRFGTKSRIISYKSPITDIKNFIAIFASDIFPCFFSWLSINKSTSSFCCTTFRTKFSSFFIPFIKKFDFTKFTKHLGFTITNSNVYCNRN